MDGEEHFVVRLQRVDVLLLEDDGDPKFFEDADIFEGIHCIPGEAGYRFGEDEVDLFLPALTDHPQKLRALLRGCAGYALVSECQARTNRNL